MTEREAAEEFRFAELRWQQAERVLVELVRIRAHLGAVRSCIDTAVEDATALVDDLAREATKKRQVRGTTQEGNTNG